MVHNNKDTEELQKQLDEIQKKLDELNTDLSVKYNNDKLLVKNSSGVWEETSMSPIKSIQFKTGSVSKGGAVSFNAVNLNKTLFLLDASNNDTNYEYRNDTGAYISSKTSTSVTINSNSSHGQTIAYSLQIIEFN